MSDPIITSVRNPRVQAAAALRERRERTRQGRILVDGAREIGRALDAGLIFIEAFVCHELLSSEPAHALLRRLEAAGVPMVSAAPRVFEKLAYGERAEEIVGVARTPRASLDRLVLPACPLIAVLEGCEKPGNLGAVLRSADATGVSALLVADSRTDLFNPNVIRASVGTIFCVPTAAASAREVRDFLRGRGISIVAARVDAKTDYTAADFTRPTAIVLGSEADGLSDAWRGDDVIGIRLPMRGTADSLNVSAAAAVLLYEALRQRSPCQSLP